LYRTYQTISAHFRIAAIQDDARGDRLSEIALGHAHLLDAIQEKNLTAALSRLREHILNGLPSLVARLDAQAVGHNEAERHDRAEISE